MRAFLAMVCLILFSSMAYGATTARDVLTKCQEAEVFIVSVRASPLFRLHLACVELEA
jgi:hypothetical protein